MTTGFDPTRYRRDFFIQHDRPDLPFAAGRPPVFSSAAAAQDKVNASRVWRRWGDTFIAWQYGEWLDEAAAHGTAAFLGDWSAISKVEIEGPDATRFLQHLGVADLSRLPVGRIRHFVMTDANGKIATEGVLGRMADNSYYYTAGGGEWIVYHAASGAWDVTARLATPDYFIFELQGPCSIEILEAAARTGLRHIAFNTWDEVVIAGARVRILRTGISGELGYEIHGATVAGAAVWEALYEAGLPMGLQPLGMRCQVLSHIESGIATAGFDYMPASIGGPGGSNISVSGGGQRIIGTYPFAAVEDLFRSPFELNWCSARVVERGDFIGADALRAELAGGGPARRLVGLVWEPADVMEVYSSLFDQGDIAPQMDMPRRYAAEYLAIHREGALVGCATSRVYSPRLRRMISFGLLDRELAEAGLEVEVAWGLAPGSGRPIRARTIALPFKPDRRRTDVALA
ncbi:MAG: aminomethyltransferase family protein [Sphingomonadales bacterium]|nr:aminomethyltransferase family protein [Sphingomonadales bacterium]